MLEGAAIPAYQCPVDPLAAEVRGLVPSDLINSETGFANNDDGMLKRTVSNGLVGVRPADISDGLSQTVAFSERLTRWGGTVDDQLDNSITRRRLMGFTDATLGTTQIDVSR